MATVSTKKETEREDALLDQWLPPQFATKVAKDMDGEFKASYIRHIRHRRRKNKRIMKALLKLAGRHKALASQLLKLSN